MPVGLFLAIGILGGVIFFIFFIMALLDEGPSTLFKIFLGLFLTCLLSFGLGAWAVTSPKIVAKTQNLEIHEIPVPNKNASRQEIWYGEDEDFKILDLTDKYKIWFNSKFVKVTSYHQWFGLIYLSREDKIEAIKGN